jgi:hypothetical protein
MALLLRLAWLLLAAQAASSGGAAANGEPLPTRQQFPRRQRVRFK